MCLIFFRYSQLLCRDHCLQHSLFALEAVPGAHIWLKHFFSPCELVDKFFALLLVNPPHPPPRCSTSDPWSAWHSSSSWTSPCSQPRWSPRGPWRTRSTCSAYPSSRSCCRGEDASDGARRRCCWRRKREGCSNCNTVNRNIYLDYLRYEYFLVLERLVVLVCSYVEQQVNVPELAMEFFLLWTNHSWVPRLILAHRQYAQSLWARLERMHSTPTDPLRILEPQSPSTDVSELLKACRSADCEALKL